MPQKRRDIRNIYLSEGDLPLWDRFKAVAKREGRSMSKVALELIRDYVTKHEPGNPQLPITKFVEGAPSPEGHVLCRRCGEPATVAVFLPFGITTHTCGSCFRRLKARGQVKGYKAL